MSPKKSDKSRLVLIDGAGGYIGGHLVEEFCRSGYRVRATDLPGTDFSISEKAGAEIVPADILKPAELKMVMQGVDWLVHPAAAFDLGLRELVGVGAVRATHPRARDHQLLLRADD